MSVFGKNTQFRPEGAQTLESALAALEKAQNEISETPQKTEFGTPLYTPKEAEKFTVGTAVEAAPAPAPETPAVPPVAAQVTSQLVSPAPAAPMPFKAPPSFSAFAQNPAAQPPVSAPAAKPMEKPAFSPPSFTALAKNAPPATMSPTLAASPVMTTATATTMTLPAPLMMDAEPIAPAPITPITQPVSVEQARILLEAILEKPQWKTALVPLARLKIVALQRLLADGQERAFYTGGLAIIESLLEIFGNSQDGKQLLACTETLISEGALNVLSPTAQLAQAIESFRLHNQNIASE